MDNFLESYDLLKLNQEDISHPSRFFNKKAEGRNKESPPSHSQQKRAGPDQFIAEFYQTLKENLCKSIEREGRNYEAHSMKSVCHDTKIGKGIE
jgi:hypothetical protein